MICSLFLECPELMTEEVQSDDDHRVVGAMIFDRTFVFWKIETLLTEIHVC